MLCSIKKVFRNRVKKAVLKTTCTFKKISTELVCTTANKDCCKYKTLL